MEYAGTIVNNKMSNRNQCPVCASKKSKTLFAYKDFPYFTVPLPLDGKEKIFRVYEINQLKDLLKVNICEECNHCYLCNLPDQGILEDLYSNYYSYPSALEGHYKPERDDRFLEFFNHKINPLCKENKLNSILEVGCFDGYILYHLQKDGFAVTGCDPSEGAEIGEKYGVNIMRKFFEIKEFQENRLTYDIVISRHFVEHVNDPKEFIKDLREIVNPGGLLILETPNVEFYLERGLLDVFSFQHLHVFSVDSLEYAAKETEMKIVKMEKNQDNLICVAIKGKSGISARVGNGQSVSEKFIEEFGKKKKRLKELISDYIINKKTIGMWGAGGAGLAALLFYEIPAESVDFLIDSDPNKWDMEYLNYSFKIVSPEMAKKLKPDLIIITSSFSASIQEQIIKMDFQCSVLKLFPTTILTTRRDIASTK